MTPSDCKPVVVTVADVRAAAGAITVPPNAIITPAAREQAETLGIQFVLEGKAESPVVSADTGSAVCSSTAVSDLAGRIDHTNLSPVACRKDIETLVGEATRYGFAAVCVHPVRVAMVAAYLQCPDVAVCATVGFPSGAHETEIKRREAVACVDAGAREIDMVANSGWLRDGEYQRYAEDILAVRRALGKTAILKVIVEASLLTPADLVRAAAMAVASGADFVKTSTGVYGQARLTDVRLLKRVVGNQAGVKASGGIKSAAFARELIAAGADRIGTSSSVTIVRENDGGKLPSDT